MANQSQGGYELHGEYESVSISSKLQNSGDGRHLNLMMQTGNDTHPGDGWTEADHLHRVDVSEVPDGRQLEDGESATYGYEDGATYQVYVKPGTEREIVTVAKKTGAE